MTDRLLKQTQDPLGIDIAEGTRMKETSPNYRYRRCIRSTTLKFSKPDPVVSKFSIRAPLYSVHITPHTLTSNAL